MAQDNVEVVRRLFEAANARDYAGALELIADDVVLVIHGDVGSVAGDGAVGKEAFSRWFTEWFRMFEDGYRFEIGDAREEGERVVLDVTPSRTRPPQRRRRDDGFHVGLRVARRAVRPLRRLHEVSPLCLVRKRG